MLTYHKLIGKTKKKLLLGPKELSSCWLVARLKRMKRVVANFQMMLQNINILSFAVCT